MHSFINYVEDKRRNATYHLAKKHAQSGKFMSFTEATWQSKNSTAVPNGITAFPILSTMNHWIDRPNGKHFDLVRESRAKLYILEVCENGSDYSEESYLEDLQSLVNSYPLPANFKLIKNYKSAMVGKNAEDQSYLKEAINKEENKFKYMVEDATKLVTKPDEKLWQVTKWLAAGAKDPDENFSGNASQRWTNILRGLGYSAFVMEDIALFLSTHAFEVIDEYENR